MSGHVAIVGAGVIGAAWAARFVMHGIDVKISDPNPEAGRIVDEVLDNARAAWVDLGLPDPTEGSVSVVGSIAEAVEGAIHVQESVPENPAIKVPILEQIAAACPSSQLSQNSSILVSVFLFHDPSSLFLLLSAFFSVVFFFLFASPLYL